MSVSRSGASQRRNAKPQEIDGTLRAVALRSKTLELPSRPLTKYEKPVAGTLKTDII
jgi:hypothetical protein